MKSKKGFIECPDIHLNGNVSQKFSYIVLPKIGQVTCVDAMHTNIGQYFEEGLEMHSNSNSHKTTTNLTVCQ